MRAAVAAAAACTLVASTAWGASAAKNASASARTLVVIDGAGVNAKEAKITWTRTGATAQLKLDAAALQGPIGSWLAASQDGSGPTRSVRVVALDDDLHPAGEIDLPQAKVVEVNDAPAADADSKDPSSWTLTLQSPGASAASTVATPVPTPSQQKAKEALAAKFVWTLSGYAHSDKVKKVLLSPAALSPPDAAGSPRAVRMTIPRGRNGENLPPLMAWLQGGDEARTARLDLQDADGKTMATLDLKGVVAESIAVSEARGETDDFDVDLHFSSFDVGGSGGAPSTAGKTFGNLYPAGDAGQVAVDRAEWSVERYAVKDEEPVVPTAEQKLLVVHARIRNTSADRLALAPGTIQVVLADASGATSDGTGRAIDETTHEPLSRTLDKGAEAKVALIALVPAKAVGSRLEITGSSDERLGLLYDLKDPKNAIVKLSVPFVAAGDSTGSVALEHVTAKPGVAYPLGDYDLTFVRLDRVASFAGGGPAWVATVRARNRAMIAETLAGSTFTGHLTFTGSDDVTSTAIYPTGTTSDALNTTLQPATDAAIRIVFPTDVSGTPKRMWVGEGDSRVYEFEKPAAGGG